MRALIIFGFPLDIGGHFKSSFAFFKELRSRGFEFKLLIPDSLNSIIYNDFYSICSEIYVWEDIMYSPYLMCSPVKRKLLQICINNGIEIVFAQDFIAMVSALRVSTIAKIPLFYTKAGGPVNQYFPPLQIPTIVFSKELKKGFINKFNFSDSNLAYIPERIECDLYLPLSRVDLDIINQYRIPINDFFKIFMAVRFEQAKIQYIKTLISTIKQNKYFFKDVNLIIAGDGSLKGEILNMIAQTNGLFKKPVIYYIGKVYNSNHLVHIYNYVNIVIGSGRGILEPMSCGVNVVMARSDKEALEINEINFDEIMYWNCSIRVFDKIQNTSSLFDILKKHKDSKSKKTKILRQLVIDNYNIIIGVDKLIDFVLKHKNKSLNYFDLLSWIVRYKIFNYLRKINNIVVRITSQSKTIFI